MPTRNYSASVGGGVNISQSQSRTADGGSDREVTILKGYAGTLTTRTDANTGTITLDAGHGISTSDNVDIYAVVGGVLTVQYNVTVGTVSGDSMPFDLGIGDDLPVVSSAVVVSIRQQVNVDVDGDNLVLLALKQKFASSSVTSMGHVDFHDSADDEIAEIDLQPNGVQVFDVTGGSANPFTGDPITYAMISNGSSVYDATFQMTWLQDTTP